MQIFKQFIRERANGFILLSLAGLVAFLIALDFRSVQSSDERAAAETPMAAEGEILGEDSQNTDLPPDTESPDQAESGSSTGQASVPDNKTAIRSGNNEDKATTLVVEKSAKKKKSKKSDADKKKDDDDSSGSAVIVAENAGSGADEDEQAVQLINATIKVEGDESFAIQAEPDSTVFDLMKKADADGKLSFRYETYSFGIFIYEINGIGSKDDMTHWWKLSVNGHESSVGASDCKVSDGDKIEWEYTSASF